MENTFKKQIEIPSQKLDLTGRLRMEECMSYLQDVANDHCETLSADRWNLMKSSNAFWVVTKVKVKVEDMPKLDDKLEFETWTIEPTAVKFERDAQIKKEGQVLVSLKSEWVALDADTRKIRPAKTLVYPFAMKNRTDRAIEGKFATLNHEISEKDYCYSRKIYFGDLDINNHVNNCYYSRFVFDCFSSSELMNKKVDTYEIHFVNECREGDELNFYLKDVDGGNYVEARVGDKQIVKAFITWKK